MKTLLKNFLHDESGATAIEYGLIAAGISLAILGSLQLIGNNLKAKFANIATALQ